MATLGNLSNAEQFECLTDQIRVLAISYIAFQAIDWLLISEGNKIYVRSVSNKIIIFQEKDEFYCIDEKYVVAGVASGGSVFLIFYNLFFIIFGIIIWVIFFRLPDRYGIINKRRNPAIKFNQSHHNNASVNLYKSTMIRDEEVNEILKDNQIPMLSP